MTDYHYMATLDAEQILETLTTIESRFKQMERAGKRAFKAIEDGGSARRDTGGDAGDIGRDAARLEAQLQESRRAADALAAAMHQVGEEQQFIARYREAIKPEIIRKAARAYEGLGEAARKARRQVASVAEEAKIRVSGGLTDRESATATAEALRSARRYQELSSEQKTATRALTQEIMRQIRANKDMSRSLGELTSKHGEQVVRVQQSTSSMTRYQREANDIVRSNRQIARSMDAAEEAGLELSLTFNRATTAARRFDTQTSQTGRTLRDAFAIGAVAGTVQALTNEVIQLGKAALRMAQDFVRGITEIAVSTESVKKSFQAALGGEQGATFLMRLAREESLRLGVDMDELAQTYRRVLPAVSNVEELERIGEVIAVLQAIDPRSQVATVAVMEAITAQDFQSIRRSFEIPTDGLKEIQDELGNVTGFLQFMNEYAEAAGLSFVTLQKTGGVALNRLDALVSQFQATAGEELLAGLVGNLNDLFDVVMPEGADGTKQVTDELVDLAEAVGALLALVADLSFDRIIEFGQDLDTGDLVDKVQQIGDGIIALDQALKTIGTATDDTWVGNLVDALFDLERMVQAVTLSIGILHGWLVGIGTIASHLDDIILSTDVQTEIAKANVAANAATLEVMLKYSEGLKETILRQEEWDRSLQEATADADELTVAVERLEDAQIGVIATLRALEISEKELETAREKMLETLKDQEKDYNFKVEEEAVKHNLKMLEIAEDYQEKRVDALQKSLNQETAAWRKYQSDRDKELRRLGDKFEDIDIEQGREEVDRALERRNELLEIEKDYLRRIRELRYRYAADAEEAIRQQDAIQLLRLRRNLQRNLDMERRRRDDRVADLGDEARAEEEEQEEARRRDEEDARRSHGRKLRDLREALDFRLQELRIASAQEIELINLREERVRADEKQGYDQRIEQMALAQDKRREEIEAGIDAEIQAVKDSQAKLVAAEQAVTQAMRFQWEQRVLEKAKYVDQMNALDDQVVQGGGAPGGGGVPVPESTDGDGGTGPSHRAPTRAGWEVYAWDEAQNSQLRRGLLDLQDVFDDMPALEVQGFYAGTIGYEDALARYSDPLVRALIREAVGKGPGKGDKRAGGGGVIPGVDYWIGEEGPEKVRFPEAGYVQPNGQAQASAPSLYDASGNITNVRQSDAQISFLNPDAVSQAQKAVMERIAIRVMRESLR